MKKRIFQDKIIVYKKDKKTGHYLAVSLNFDLMAEGNTLGQALDRLKEATNGYLEICMEDNEPDEKIYRSAPKKYFELYDLFEELDKKKRKEKKLPAKLLRKEDISTHQQLFRMNFPCYA